MGEMANQLEDQAHLIKKLKGKILILLESNT